MTFFEFLIWGGIVFAVIMAAVVGAMWITESQHAQWQDRRMHRWQSDLEQREEVVEGREEEVTLREFIMGGREAELGRRAAVLHGSALAAAELIGDDTVIMDLDWNHLGVSGES